MNIQDIVALFLVAWAAIFLIRRSILSWQKNLAGECGGCSGCHKDKA